MNGLKFFRKRLRTRPDKNHYWANGYTWELLESKGIVIVGIERKALLALVAKAKELDMF